MSASESQRLKKLYEFGPFRVDPDQEILLRAGQPVALTRKTFQILLVLVRRHKELVTKDDLMKAVWPDTFVEEANLSRNIFMLRKALGETPQDHQYILTVPGRGYRFAEDVRLLPEQQVSIVAAQHSTVQVQVKETKPWEWIWAAVVLLLAVTGGATWLLLHRKPVLTEKDTVVLADFSNSTGDPVFDETLRQGLSIQLEQSPFLSIISDQQVQQTLRMMGQKPDAKLMPEIAREICQRTASAAVLDGSIAQIGSPYLLTVKAVNCMNGETLVSAEAQASDKNHLLDALGRVAAETRNKLGESLGTVQKFDTQLEQATTSSLEALQAYTLGRRAMIVDNAPAVIPFFQQAIRLDPNFAMAHASLGSNYAFLGESGLAAQHFQTAYDLRAHVSEWERYYIESNYYQYLKGDLETARQIYEVFAQTYPRNPVPPTRLCLVYISLGQHDKALAAIREALRRDPTRLDHYDTLVATYINTNRLQEARATAEGLQAKGYGSSNSLHFNLYALAFLANDSAAMAREVEWAAGKPGIEDAMLGQEADTAAYFGQLEKSSTLSRRAMVAAMRTEQRERAATIEVKTALREVLFGNNMEARQQASSALKLSTGKDVLYGAALALALAGETSQVQALANDLARRFPADTVVQFNYLPTVRGQLALSHNHASKGIELLQTATPFELGQPGTGIFTPSLYPAYVRGEAYLVAGQGAQAAAEFQKVIAHLELVINDPIGAVGRLQLARAYTMAGDKAKAKSAYQDFLTLWKDADPDIPILNQAKAEYAKLH